MTSSNELDNLLLNPDVWEAELDRRARRKIDTYYPDSGPLRRELYVKHVKFFELGKEHRERLFLAANRVGKTDGVGAYEVALHLTGQYPAWWPGRRFTTATRWWVAGDTGATTRDIIQNKLCGEPDNLGTGMIPGDSIVSLTRKPVSQAIDFMYVRHSSGGRSWVQFKSYEQGQAAFFGTHVHGVWLDEEPPKEIYDECLLRTMGTGGDNVDGMVLCTFTPLLGMTEVVRSYLHQAKE